MARRVESAEEYVRFYRFWSWEYVKRNPRFWEIAELLRRADADIEAQGHEAPNLDDVIEKSAGAMEPGDAVMLEGATVQDQALAALLAEKVEELGLDGLRDADRLIVSDADLLGHYLMETFGYQYDLFSWEQSTPTEILGKIVAGEALEPPVSGRSDQKGFQLLGPCARVGGQRVVSHEGVAWEGYDALLAVDFNTTIDSLVRELEYTKKIIAHAREAESGARPDDVPDVSLEIEQLRIRGRKGVSFDYQANEPRAVGLWLWDYVHGKYGGKGKRGAISEAVREFCGSFDLDALGYAMSEMSVFQKLYRKTGECIEKAEVLALK